MPFPKVKLEPDKRAGVLTHPYLLAALAYTVESSPIHRGVFLGRGLLGLPLRPPPEAFTPLAARPAPEPDDPRARDACRRSRRRARPATASSTRSASRWSTSTPSADTARRRTASRSTPPAATRPAPATPRRSPAPRELATFLADSEEAHAAFVEQLFHHLVKQPVRAYGINRPEELRKSFSENGFNIRKLVVEMAVTAAMANRETRNRRSLTASEPAPCLCPALAASSSATSASAPPPSRSSSTCRASASPTRRRGSSGSSSCSAPTASSRRPSGPTRKAN